MRRKLLEITNCLIGDALKNPNVQQGFYIRSDGVPADLKIVGCHWNEASTGCVFVVESAEFEEVDILQPLPYLVVTFHLSAIEAENAA